MTLAYIFIVLFQSQYLATLENSKQKREDVRVARSTWSYWIKRLKQETIELTAQSTPDEDRALGLDLPNSGLIDIDDKRRAKL